MKRNKYIIYTHVKSIGHPRPTNLNYFSTLLATFKQDDSLSFSLWCLNTYSLEGTPLHICVSHPIHCQEDYRLLCFFGCVFLPLCFLSVPRSCTSTPGTRGWTRASPTSPLTPPPCPRWACSSFLKRGCSRTLLTKCTWPVDACTAASWPSEGVLNP